MFKGCKHERENVTLICALCRIPGISKLKESKWMQPNVPLVMWVYTDKDGPNVCEVAAGPVA